MRDVAAATRSFALRCIALSSSLSPRLVASRREVDGRDGEGAGGSGGVAAAARELEFQGRRDLHAGWELEDNTPIRRESFTSFYSQTSSTAAVLRGAHNITQACAAATLPPHSSTRIWQYGGSHILAVCEKDGEEKNIKYSRQQMLIFVKETKPYITSTSYAMLCYCCKQMNERHTTGSGLSQLRVRI